MLPLWLLPKKTVPLVVLGQELVLVVLGQELILVALLRQKLLLVVVLNRSSCAFPSSRPLMDLMQHCQVWHQPCGHHNET